MAKQQPDLSALFRPTEAPQPPAEAEASPELASDRTLPIGVGLKQSELRDLDRIAGDLGIARNALMRWGLLFFLREYRAGRVAIDVETEERRRVKMP